MSERWLARCCGFDVGTDDRGHLVLHGAFEGEGCGQGLGYIVDADFLLSFLAVFGVDAIQKVNGKVCWVVGDSMRITMIEPMFRKDGKVFNIAAWSARQAGGSR